ncbi:MogA/MoaB family molybdenum cofactor biosynthesis protein [soil metagenome]
MSSPTSEHHHELAAGRGPVAVAVVTVSDSRDAGSDANGDYLKARISAAGHTLAHYGAIADEPAQVATALEQAVLADANVVVFNGGTGIAPRDRTFDVLDRLIERPIPGFGELFRMLSWEQVGSAAMLSRASAGVCRGAVIFSLPGSPAAVRLGWERLIEPELEHLVWQTER